MKIKKNENNENKIKIIKIMKIKNQNDQSGKSAVIESARGNDEVSLSRSHHQIKIRDVILRGVHRKIEKY